MSGGFYRCHALRVAERRAGVLTLAFMAGLLTHPVSGADKMPAGWQLSSRQSLCDLERNAEAWQSLAELTDRLCEKSDFTGPYCSDFWRSQSANAAAKAAIIRTTVVSKILRGEVCKTD